MGRIRPIAAGLMLLTAATLRAQAAALRDAEAERPDWDQVGRLLSESRTAIYGSRLLTANLAEPTRKHTKKGRSDELGLMWNDLMELAIVPSWRMPTWPTCFSEWANLTPREVEVAS